MTWDADRVRIELCDALTIESTPGRNDMVPKQAAEIWLYVDGKAKRGKPQARIVAASRPALLRDLADWIEQNDDPGLRGVVESMPHG